MRQLMKSLFVGTALFLTSCEESQQKGQSTKEGAQVVKAEKAPSGTTQKEPAKEAAVEKTAVKEEAAKAETPKAEEPKKTGEAAPSAEAPKPEAKAEEPKEEGKTAPAEPVEAKNDEPHKAVATETEAKPEEPAKAPAKEAEAKPETPALDASAAKEGKSAPAAENQNEEAFVQQRIEELKVMQPGAKFVQWIKSHGATFMMAKRVFGRDIDKSSDELDQHFSKTFAEFVSANISTFLPLIADYDIQKVVVAQAGKSLKKFTLHLKERKTGEESIVNVIATNKNLRIVDITVQETSLVSILKTAAQDILNLPKDKQKEAWDKLIGASAK